MIDNLFDNIPDTVSAEIFEELISGPNFKLERIISDGQATPPGEWMDQERDEWVILLQGSAGLLFADEKTEHFLKPGAYMRIPAHTKHRVEWTDPNQKTVWLALHYTCDPLPR